MFSVFYIFNCNAEGQLFKRMVHCKYMRTSCFRVRTFFQKLEYFTYLIYFFVDMFFYNFISFSHTSFYFFCFILYIYFINCHVYFPLTGVVDRYIILCILTQFIFHFSFVFHSLFLQHGFWRIDRQSTRVGLQMNCFVRSFQQRLCNGLEVARD